MLYWSSMVGVECRLVLLAGMARLRARPYKRRATVDAFSVPRGWQASKEEGHRELSSTKNENERIQVLDSTGPPSGSLTGNRPGGVVYVLTVPWPSARM